MEKGDSKADVEGIPDDPAPDHDDELLDIEVDKDHLLTVLICLNPNIAQCVSKQSSIMHPTAKGRTKENISEKFETWKNPKNHLKGSHVTM